MRLTLRLSVNWMIYSPFVSITTAEVTTAAAATTNATSTTTN